MHFISSNHNLIQFVCVYTCTYLLVHAKVHWSLFYFSGDMPLEFAMIGVVLIKYVVFSFGVLLLEIMSGKKKNSLYHFDYSLNLIG